MALINSLCAMLRTTPFHRDNYSRLVLSVIIQYYQRCSDRFQDVVSRNSQDLTDSRLLISARWAQRDDLSSCLASLFTAVCFHSLYLTRAFSAAEHSPTRRAMLKEDKRATKKTSSSCLLLRVTRLRKKTCSHQCMICRSCAAFIAVLCVYYNVSILIL